ncbi:hypothetical protein Ddye_028530 [Dipteronia dyeriana]|uniref:Uncharacterized protein n=1 Tax=Dipteronia dyeriana TaxID=168575 RepID=A0AAD9WKW7_9ROSI|nr:hypothetical protein Ddye_028530 [Dipteronia dyeriana]
MENSTTHAYKFDKQVTIVTTSMALYNFIRRETIADVEFGSYNEDADYVSEDEESYMNLTIDEKQFPIKRLGGDDGVYSGVGFRGGYPTMPASDYSFLKLPRTLEDLQILRSFAAYVTEQDVIRFGFGFFSRPPPKPINRFYYRNLNPHLKDLVRTGSTGSGGIVIPN